MSMDDKTVTLVSGILLLVVFAVVGWNLRRRSEGEQQRPGKESS